MASVSYKISGKYDGNAVKQAQSGLSSLGNVAGNLKNIFAGLGAVFAVGKIIGFAKDCTDAFMVQEEALNRLSQAANNNSKITEAGLKRIIDYTGKLQGKSIYGDETLQGHAAYLTAMGLEEKQIKNVLNAAVELSSAGVGDLDSNVKNLSKTLSGQKGKLADLIPEMRNLTKEQLENGEAIDIVSRKYAGFAENLSQNTLKGVSTQFGNLVGDIKEKLGSITGALKFDGMKKMLPILDNINAWLEENKDKIINIFLNLPEVAVASFSLIKDMLKKLFTIEGFTQYIKIVFTNLLTIAKNTFMVLFNIVKAVAITIWEPLKTGFEWIGYGIKAAFAVVVNFFINKINDFLGWFTDKINWCIDKINSIREFFGASKLDNIEKGIAIEVKTMPEKPTGVNTDNIGNAWADVGTSIVDGVKDTYNGLKNSTKELGKLFGKELQTFGNKINEITNRKVQSGESKTVTNSDSNTETNKTNDKKTNILKDIMKAFGEIGTLVSSIMEKTSVITIIISLVAKFVGVLSSVSPAFNELINGITYMMKAIAEAIAPFIESIVKPLLGILKTLGDTLGAILAPIFESLSILLLPIIEFVSIILEVLSPILKILGQLVSIFVLLNPAMNLFTFALNILANAIKFLYNYILMPVVNFLVRVMAGIGNTFIAIWNAIVGVLNSINIFGWHPFNLSKKSYIDTNNLTLKAIGDSPANGGGGNTNTGKTNSSKGASYTAAKDIYVNIYYQNSYVNGDARQIALSIRDEIKSAERLGY
ncbi:hypothetical protein HMPREF9723_02157 [Treponema denticola OTK]|uniref:Uncharacterized protein n=1 Tax=Treponema denticola OTK TaxID=999434 RepID=A0A0F6MMZ4_TREDN|nr:hypothetical protein [Treponema denticola]EMB20697.1 hypothetical protein HMPREF9723_02157 [Treponema denticola OTK]